MSAGYSVLNPILVTATTDYSSAVFSKTVDGLFFDTLNAATATFSWLQFNNADIATDWVVDGESNAPWDKVVVTGGSIDASTWRFASGWDESKDTVILKGAATADIITGTFEADKLIGYAGDDRLTGGGGNDTIKGGDGSDAITGGAGADKLYGGEKYDEFHYGSGNELSSGEAVDGGHGKNDTIFLDGSLGSRQDYDFRLATVSNIEQLKFASAAGAEFDGGQIGGASGLNAVIASSGSDALIVHGNAVDLSAVAFQGWGANSASSTADSVDIFGTGGNDTLTGSQEYNTIMGYAGDDLITGGGDIDVIDGGAGSDTASGGNGYDSFLFSSPDEIGANESIDGGGSFDSAVVYEANTEQSYDLRHVQMTSIEWLSFEALAGASSKTTALLSADQMAGISQVHVYADDAALLVDGGSADLSKLDVTLYGAARLAIEITGTSNADEITGSSLADTVTGGGGADTLDGGAGADVFKIGYPSDLAAGAVIQGGDGIDALRLASSFNGFADFRPIDLENVERLVMMGNEQSVAFTDSQIAGFNRISGAGSGHYIEVDGGAIDMSGITFTSWNANNLITLLGTSGNDTITGSSQADILGGSDGSDILNGGEGDDILVGGMQGDTLTGGAGADTFSYNDLVETRSGAGFGIDTIADFTQGEDKINFAGAASLTFIGSAAYSKSGSAELRYYIASGNTYVTFDSNGDGTNEGQIIVTGEIDFLQSDFIL